MDTEYVPFLLVTANVGSVFEDVSVLLFLLRRACCHSKWFIRFYMGSHSIFLSASRSFLPLYMFIVWRWLLFCFNSNCLISFDVGVLCVHWNKQTLDKKKNVNILHRAKYEKKII